jgi:hypothetical protein
MIHDTVVSMDKNAPMDEIYEDILAVYLINKAQKAMYKDSKTSLLSTMLLLVKLKVINGIPNTFMRQILRYTR